MNGEEWGALDVEVVAAAALATAAASAPSTVTNSRRTGRAILSLDPSTLGPAVRDGARPSLESDRYDRSLATMNNRPPVRDYVTTEKLLAVTKSTRDTLYRWVALRLLLRPRILTDSKGHPFAAWSVDSLDRVRFIIGKEREGLMMDDIGLQHLRYFGESYRARHKPALSRSSKTGSRRAA